ncbi:hypothetical protein [uncultured Vagococcus sp.]|uniref:hypothetical protein n=1 Tax=uncultured Vagococcus sp. TaxID=189676 RepID=UPI00258574FF|nr:hypothetical protein [uncultured Vagococcus sp.]
MGTFDALTKMYDLVSGSSDPILLKSVLEVQQDLIRLQEENRLLRQEVNELKNQEITRSTLKYEGNAYYQNENGPYCTTCFDVQGKLVRLALKKIEYQDFLVGVCGNCNSEDVVTTEKNLTAEEERKRRSNSIKNTSRLARETNNRNQFKGF